MISYLTTMVKLIVLSFGTLITILVLVQLWYQNVMIQYCSIDPILNVPYMNRNVSTTTSISSCNVYSDTYDIARRRFRTAVKQLILIQNSNYATVNRFVSLNIDTMEEKDIMHIDNVDDTTTTNTIDIAVITVSIDDDGNDTSCGNDNNTETDESNNSNNGIVVHISGTHGIEGYAGSAIQVAFIEHLVGQNKQQQMSSSSSSCRTSSNAVTIIFIHAFNPFGMKQYRRVNEHNIDLNRNGLYDITNHWDRVIKYNQHYNKDNYTTIVHNRLLTKSLSKISSTNSMFIQFYIWYERYLYSWVRMTRALIEYGIPTIKAALVGGQYHISTGLFYGGGSGNTTYTNEPSLTIVRQWMEKFLKDRRNVSNGTTNECVTWIDVHTGLGPTGIDTLLFGNDKESSTPNTNEVQLWFPKSLISSPSTTTTKTTTTDTNDPDTDTANAVQQGYENVIGLCTDYYQNTLFPKHQYTNPHNLFFVQEFGTVPSILTGNALVVEHEIYQYLSSLHQQISNVTDLSTKYSKAILGAAFNPQRTEFRINVLQRGINVLEHAIRRSSYYSSDAGNVSKFDGDNYNNEPASTNENSVKNEL